MRNNARSFLKRNGGEVDLEEREGEVRGETMVGLLQMTEELTTKK